MRGALRQILQPVGDAKQYAARGGLQEPDDGAPQRGLVAAALTHHAQRLTAVHSQVHVVDGPDLGDHPLEQPPQPDREVGLEMLGPEASPAASCCQEQRAAPLRVPPRPLGFLVRKSNQRAMPAHRCSGLYLSRSDCAYSSKNHDGEPRSQRPPPTRTSSGTLRNEVLWTSSSLLGPARPMTGMLVVIHST